MMGASAQLNTLTLAPLLRQGGAAQLKSELPRHSGRPLLASSALTDGCLSRRTPTGRQHSFPGAMPPALGISAGPSGSAIFFNLATVSRWLAVLAMAIKRSDFVSGQRSGS